MKRAFPNDFSGAIRCRDLESSVTGSIHLSEWKIRSYSPDMGPLKSFLLCLAPAILSYVILLISGKAGGEGALSFAMLLICLGALVSGGCVAYHLHRSMEPKGEASSLKIFLGILVFLGVGIAYLGVGFAGCCGVAAVSGALY